MTEAEFDARGALPAHDRKPAAGRTVLVDTSLLIELQKRDEYSRPVRASLSGFRFKGASSYSKLEFKRAWIQVIAYIHSSCCQPGAQSLADVFDRIQHRLSNRFQCRDVQTCLQAMVTFLEIEKGGRSPRAQLARLRAFCKTRVLEAAAAFRNTATGEFKGTGCVRAEEPPTEHSDGSLNVTIRRCFPQKIQCRIHDFFSENSPSFVRLAEAIESNEGASEELKTMHEHIRLAEKGPQHLCDDKHCARLADAIIAVDGSRMDVFAANNDKEWITIAKVIGKPLVNPVTGVCYR